MLSFRLDKVGDDQHMKTIFQNLETAYKSDYLLVCYENKTKAGIECKEHYHGLIKSPKFIHKPESDRDKLKKYFKEVGFEKTLAHVQIVKTDDAKELLKAYTYTAKQQQIFYTNLDIERTTKILQTAKDYQEEQKPKNNWFEHQQEIFKTFKEYYDKYKKITRNYMLTEIFYYIYNWNQIHLNDDLFISRPCNNTVMTFIQNTEIKLLSIEQAKNMWMEDFRKENIFK